MLVTLGPCKTLGITIPSFAYDLAVADSSWELLSSMSLYLILVSDPNTHPELKLLSWALSTHMGVSVNGE